MEQVGKGGGNEGGGDGGGEGGDKGGEDGGSEGGDGGGGNNVNCSLATFSASELSVLLPVNILNGRSDSPKHSEYNVPTEKV